MVDPAKVYNSAENLNENGLSYVTTLTKSSFGIITPKNTWNERDMKRSLARWNGEIDCIVIGSSRVLQISSQRENKSLTHVCGSLLNLGVSGGTLEDYLALSFEVMQRETKPKKIIFGVDPWALNFKNDARWQEYELSYNNMIASLGKSNLRIIDKFYIKWKLFSNLINFEYLLLSLETIISEKSLKTLNAMPQITEAPQFDLSVGIEAPVTLPDGSHIYSRQYIIRNAPPKVRIGGENYKIRQGRQVSEDAVELFSKLVKRLKMLEIDTVLLLTPYHQNVWVDENSLTSKAMQEVEARIKQLGTDLNLKVLGSYSPQKIGCRPDEFYDFMHTKDSCLAKIKN
ncbi:hypothetical protein [Desulforhopalus sp. 52FAK]